ncbi:MAG TPA: NAD-dependent epimerase/dehydratase [Thermoanaerobaculia bacterium]|nr:NAD-dependent epimerase/dehydratase [Thermoanaerobaculia bacterium]
MRVERVARVAVDLLIVNVSLAVALVLRFLALVYIELPRMGMTLTRETVLLYVDGFWTGCLPLTIITIAAYWLSGFYTRTMFYRGRYKAIAIAQATLLSYLIYGFGTYYFFKALNMPRGALALACGINIALALAARLWATLWRIVLRRERSRIDVEAEIKDVLVIGGAGYIGSALVPKLLQEGYRVKLLDMLLFGRDPIAAFLEHPRLEILEADFRQIDTVVQAVRDVDAVVHLGGLVGDPACALDEELTIDINLSATRMIAEVAKGAGVGRFVFASSCSVYGASDEELDERSALNPVSLYARSKIASEKVLLAIADERFSPAILRFGTIYGLSGRTRFDLVVNLLTAKAVLDGEITVFGGDQWRPFLHVDDAARSIVAVLKARREVVSGEIFNVGSNAQNCTLHDVAELIHTMVPQARIIDTPASDDRRNYRVRFSKIEKRLGFAPKWTLAEGIQQVIEAIRSHAVSDYRDPRYSNVAFLSERAATAAMRRVRDWERSLIEPAHPE